MIQMKAIHPAPFNSNRIYERMQEAVRRTIDLADKEFAKTYATWDHKPKFVKEFRSFPSYLYGATYTVHQIYEWVNSGTKGPYLIPKAGPKLLAFPSGYKAKTTPRTLHSGSGGSFGETVFIFGQVEHPGIKPREFDKTVAVYVKPWYHRWGQEAIRVGARESGHAI